MLSLLRAQLPLWTLLSVTKLSVQSNLSIAECCNNCLPSTWSIAPNENRYHFDFVWAATRVRFSFTLSLLWIARLLRRVNSQYNVLTLPSPAPYVGVVNHTCRLRGNWDFFLDLHIKSTNFHKTYNYCFPSFSLPWENQIYNEGFRVVWISFLWTVQAREISNHHDVSEHDWLCQRCESLTPHAKQNFGFVLPWWICYWSFAIF